MNFILKNIGWIALFIFFAIMLLIISANQKDNNGVSQNLQTENIESTLTGSNINSTSTGVLSELVEMLDSSDENQEQEEVKIEPEIKKESDSVKENMEEDVITASGELFTEDAEKKSILESLFGRFTNNDKQSEKSSTGTVNQQDDENLEAVEVGVVRTGDEEKENNVMEKEKSTTNKTSNKKTHYKVFSYDHGTFKDIPTYNGSFSVNQKPLPGINLKTAIGNTYKLAVDGLKLNNIYFTESHGVINMGDVVKQLTHENRFGCFRAEVLSGDESGKFGYVCKKWFKKYTVNTVANNVISTQVGDIHTVEVSELNLRNEAFDETLTVMPKGTMLEQVGDETSVGCFQVRMLNGEANDIGRIGFVCKQDLSLTEAKTSTALNSYAMKQTTQVGDMHSVSAHSLKLNNAYFNKNLGFLSYGDSLKQLTIENIHGCFSVKVLESRISSSEGKIGFVCKKYLK